MISYRKLAMRVLGHPLRVPSPPRPASHRVTALALTAAMVAGMAAPAYADAGTTINITDGTIEKAESKNGGAGIGSGYIGGSSTVNISGDAELKDVRGGNLAAGIGSGYGSDKVDVVIDGGTINATGSFNAAGIGSGDNGPSSVTISGGTITATSTSEAPAIGGGSVSISNTDAELDITATAPNADNAIRSKDGKNLDEVIQLAENGKKGLVKLVKSGTTSISRLFHNGVYADSHSTPPTA